MSWRTSRTWFSRQFNGRKSNIQNYCVKKQIRKNTTSYEVVQGSPLANRLDFLALLNIYVLIRSPEA